MVGGPWMTRYEAVSSLGGTSTSRVRENFVPAWEFLLILSYSSYEAKSVSAKW